MRQPLGCYSQIHITWMRVYVTTVTTVTTLTVKVLQRHALRSQNLTQSHRYHHNPFHFTLFKVLIRMSTFLRRFATSASAGKNMYFILAVASALPVYTILNDNTASSASVPSRSNVFVSAPPEKKLAVLMKPHLFFIQYLVRCCHQLQGFWSYCFQTF